MKTFYIKNYSIIYYPDTNNINIQRHFEYDGNKIFNHNIHIKDLPILLAFLKRLPILIKESKQDIETDPD
jgi:hypothetical protein